MPPLATQFGLLAVGVLMLVIGGKFLVSASVDTARKLSVPSLLVGLTLVAWGTSAPELALNVVSALKGRPQLAVGNIVGANICNMGLVVGVCALLRPLKVEERLIRVEAWLSAGMLSLLSLLGLLTTDYNRFEAGGMLAAFVIYSGWTIMSALQTRRRGTHLIPKEEPEGYPARPTSWWRIGTLFIAGLLLLSAGGTFASDSAVGIASSLGVPQGIVGVTIVSIGTTLPELVTGVLAVRRGQVDLAMGNALGSCLFNAGAIFGIAGLIAPPVVPDRIAVSLVTMMVLSILLLRIVRTHDRHVARAEGGLLLTIYAAFLAIQAILAARAS